MLTDDSGKSFKTAPAKFTKQLDEASASEPIPDFIRQLEAGSQALICRDRAKFLAGIGLGMIAAYWLLQLSLIYWVVALAAVLLTALIYWVTANRAEAESKTMTLTADQKIKVLQ
jgi:hypothetical protein